MAPEDIKKCQVNIGGMSYQLVGGDNEIYTRQIAGKADEKIRRILSQDPRLSQSMATVLALVNSIDELTRLYEHLKLVETTQQETRQENKELRRELHLIQRENLELKKEQQRLELLNRDFEALLNRLTSQTEPEAEDKEEADEYILGGLKQTNLEDLLRKDNR